MASIEVKDIIVVKPGAPRRLSASKETEAVVVFIVLLCAAGSLLFGTSFFMARRYTIIANAMYQW
jgi:hypothetical protein